MTNAEMMGMLTSTDPCASPPGLSFDPSNPAELAAGNQATLDVIGGVSPYTFEILESGLHVIDGSYIAWPPAYSDTYIKATTLFSASYYPHFSADPTLARDGTYTSRQWLSVNGTTTNQRWNIDLGTSKIIQQIMLENSHISGAQGIDGIKNFILQGSNNALALAQTDYASDTYWTNIETGLQAAQHNAHDFSHMQLFDITNSTAYRYLSLKIADNWGGGAYMGMRHVQFHTSQVKVYKSVEVDPQIIITAPAYSFWTALIKCTDACAQTVQAGLYTSAGKWEVAGSEATGGGATPCGNVDFRVIINGCMFVGGTCNDDLPGITGNKTLDCQAYGGEEETINIKSECGGVLDCDYVKTLDKFCWPYT